MALTDEQLNTVKAEMETGKPLQLIVRESEIPNGRAPAVRRQLIEKFGKETVQEIIRTKIRPNMLNVAIDRAVTNNIAREDITAEQIDSYVATLEDAIVRLNAKKDEL